MIELVIFDNDGTLVDSESVASVMLRQLAAEHGLSLSAQEIAQDFTGIRLVSALDKLGKRLGSTFTDADAARLAHQLQEELNRSLQPMPHIDAALGEITARKCVASNGGYGYILRCLDTAKLSHHFSPEVCFSAYDVGAWKPDPKIFLHTAQALGVEAQHCLVVEDSMTGILAAQNAQMRVLAYAPNGLPAGASTQGIEAIYDNHRKLPELIRALK